MINRSRYRDNYKKAFCSSCKGWKNRDAFYKASINNRKYSLKSRNLLRSNCKQCAKEKCSRLRREEPWKVIFWHIKAKCKIGYGKNIECLFKSANEIKDLWERDKAYHLNYPSIDRINNNDHYYYENCQFIEKGENSRKDKIKKIFVTCKNCLKLYEIIPYRLKKTKYCSIKCKGEYYARRKKTKNIPQER